MTISTRIWMHGVHNICIMWLYTLIKCKILQYLSVSEPQNKPAVFPAGVVGTVGRSFVELGTHLKRQYETCVLPQNDPSSARPRSTAHGCIDCPPHSNVAQQQSSTMSQEVNQRLLRGAEPPRTLKPDRHCPTTPPVSTAMSKSNQWGTQQRVGRARARCDSPNLNSVANRLSRGRARLLGSCIPVAPVSV